MLKNKTLVYSHLEVLKYKIMLNIHETLHNANIFTLHKSQFLCFSHTTMILKVNAV